jgi:hypothetical protein
MWVLAGGKIRMRQNKKLRIKNAELRIKTPFNS